MKKIKLAKNVLPFILLFILAPFSRAQLTHSATSAWLGCPSNKVTANQTIYSNWVFTDSTGVAHTFTGSDFTETTKQYLVSPRLPLVTCGANQSTALNTLSNDGLYFLQVTGATGSAAVVPSGFIFPKYVVLSVVYAPPGSKSNVDYGSSTMIGTTASINQSFTNSQNLSVSLSDGGAIKGMLSDKETTTVSTTFTQEADTSSSIDITKTSTNDSIAQGPASDASGVDHGADVVYIWLNPVVNLKFPPNGQIIQGDLDFDMNDMCLCMDILPLQVSQLLNPGSITDPHTLASLARAWAPPLSDGSSPALTNADLQAIADSDPWALNPSYTLASVVTSSGLVCSSDGRFCLAQASDIPYAPPGPDGQPLISKGSAGYSETTTEGTTAQDTRQVAYSVDKTISVGALGQFSLDIKAANTLTWVNKWSTLNTQKAGQSASWSVTGPAASANYQGPTLFTVYQDNVYGTFMFYPAN